MNLFYSYCDIIELTSPLITGNNLYKPAYNGKNSFIRKNKKANLIQEELFYLFRLKEDISQKVKQYNCHVKFLADKNFWYAKDGGVKKIDLTNIWKVIEDGIVNSSSIDDSYCFCLHLEKSITSKKGIFLLFNFNYYE